MSKLINTDLDFGSVAKATNLPTPTATGDAVPKSYVDAADAKAVTRGKLIARAQGLGVV